MKYQSEIIAEIVDKRGHEKSSLHYESECVQTWIDENKGNYPKLCDYQSEWLNYINENHIGVFPYETLTDVTEATVNNVVPYSYKSAILKGSTKYRDIETGEILETFEEGRNLELVSVKMPVLTTIGKNLFNSNDFINKLSLTHANDEITIDSKSANKIYYFNINHYPLYFSCELVTPNTAGASTIELVFKDGTSKHLSMNTPNNSNCLIEKELDYLIINKWGSDVTIKNIQLEYGSTPTTYEPYKSNILTVNEDVELGSVGEVEDELNSLTGQLTQRTETRAYQEGDESNSEVLTDMTNTRYKLPKEVVKTVDLSVTDQDGNQLSKIKPIEGTMHIKTDGSPIKPTFTGEIPVEAITQNLASFTEE